VGPREPEADSFLGFAEEFEATGEAPEIDGLLKLGLEAGMGGLDFDRVDPNHPAPRTEGHRSEGEEFLEKAAKVGNGHPFAQRRVGDEEREAARGAAANF